MGQRGPKPLPGNVHALRGNPSKLPLARLLDGTVQPDVVIPKIPAHLDALARKEWRRIAPELELLGLVSRIDAAALAMYCIEYARWQWAEAKIAALNRGDEKNEQGLVQSTPNGMKIQSVYLQISRKAQEMCLKAAAEFGMSPSQRSRVTASEAHQQNLPGMDPKPEQPRASFTTFS
jgi:P27 family predicted phage terminase small subunit